MNANDRKVIGLGAFVVLIALVGSIVGGTPFIPTSGVTQGDYYIVGTTSSGSLSLSSSEPTTEGSTDSMDVVIDTLNVTKVEFTFSYQDDVPGILEGDNDEFEIQITAPDGRSETLIITSGETTGTVEFVFSDTPPDSISNKTFDTVKEARKKAEEYRNTTGNGTYSVDVTATNCPGRRPIGGIFFDMDNGNDWSISIEYSHYSLAVKEKKESSKEAIN